MPQQQGEEQVGRFQPGQSGNPGGRPRTRTAHIAKKARVHTEAALNALVKALSDPKSCVAAARELLNRGYGQAPQHVELTGADGGPVEHSVTDYRASVLAGLARAPEAEADDVGADGATH
jgi:hypothetical protein